MFRTAPSSRAIRDSRKQPNFLLTHLHGRPTAIYFPKRAERGPRDSSTPMERTQKMACKPAVFLVDDEPAVLNSLRMLLKPLDWNIEAFSSAQDFLDRYDGYEPACLVLDVRMPGMSGVGLQEELKARGICLPVIMITGYSDVPVAVRTMKAGAWDFLEKPFEAEALLQRIRQAIEHHQQPGILTRLTKQLTPQEALELYREISPRLVLSILGYLDRSANVATVRQITDHLCRADVLARLRNGEHTRDKLTDELRVALDDSGIKQPLNRKTLLEILETSGVMKDLVAMEACLQRIEAA